MKYVGKWAWNYRTFDRHYWCVLVSNGANIVLGTWKPEQGTNWLKNIEFSEKPWKEHLDEFPLGLSNHCKNWALLGGERKILGNPGQISPVRQRCPVSKRLSAKSASPLLSSIASLLAAAANWPWSLQMRVWVSAVLLAGLAGAVPLYTVDIRGAPVGQQLAVLACQVRLVSS